MAGIGIASVDFLVASFTSEALRASAFVTVQTIVTFLITGASDVGAVVYIDFAHFTRVSLFEQFQVLYSRYYKNHKP